MEKFRKIFGATIAIMGILVAVCLTDGSSHEIAIRGAGVAAFLAGVCIVPGEGKETS